LVERVFAPLAVEAEQRDPEGLPREDVRSERGEA
jgi:hypothetical protein